jgi:hypothetical protein
MSDFLRKEEDAKFLVQSIQNKICLNNINFHGFEFPNHAKARTSKVGSIAKNSMSITRNEHKRRRQQPKNLAEMQKLVAANAEISSRLHVVETKMETKVENTRSKITRKRTQRVDIKKKKQKTSFDFLGLV